MVKSKRAREAAEAEAGPAATPVANDSSKADKKEKKRKRDTEDAAIINGGSDDEEKKKAAKKAKKEKKDKKAKYSGKESRKDKKDKLKDLQDLPEEAESEAEKEQEKSAEELAKEKKRAEKKAKKEKKKQEKSSSTDAAQTESTVSKPTPAASGEKPSEDHIDLDAETSQKKDRHIVFVGNLPFTATAASITAHFSTLSPIAVRCLTEKGSKNTCKGIAFVEFGEVWQQRTCLDKFHHSEFSDGKSAARKINVELTAGGGGKTKQRRQKIIEKNAKLEENRNKRITKEKTAKSEARAEQAHQEESMHPSRRAMIPGGGY